MRTFWLVNQLWLIVSVISSKNVRLSHYNIHVASRAAQSNSVYVSVLKIPIVHADSVCKSLHQNFFYNYFATIMDTHRDSDHQSQNEDNFPTFCLGLKFLNEAEKEKNNEKETRHQRRHDSLYFFRGWNATNFDRKTLSTGKTKQMTNRGNRELTLKCKLKCYVKPMKDPLGISPGIKGNQGTTWGKEKFLLTSVGMEPTTSGLDLPLLCRLSYEVGQRKSGTI